MKHWDMDFIDMKSICGIFVLSLVLVSQSAIANDLVLCKEQGEYSLDPCERLAKSGNADGQFGLGMLLLEGNGIKRDYDQSFALMHKAAMQGHAEAQLQVGQAYVNGQGVEKDYEEAYAWFLVSRENGNKVAQKAIDFMDSNYLVDQNRLNTVTQRANDIYQGTTKRRGFQYDKNKGSEIANGLIEYCDMVMPTVESVINYKKYGKPRSSVQQLMLGMTDQRAIKMMNGLIDWVWSSSIPVEKMSDRFDSMCLSESPEVDFIFP
jgi:TPR repeat protein